MKSKWWLMPLVIVFCVGCANEEKAQMDDRQSFSLVLEDKVDDNTLVKVAQVDDERDFYTTYETIYYVTNTDKLSLADAFDQGYVSVDDILKHLEFVDAANDGGSLYYRYVQNETAFANTDFLLASCNSLDGNGGIHDIFLLTPSQEELFYSVCTK